MGLLTTPSTTSNTNNNNNRANQSNTNQTPSTTRRASEHNILNALFGIETSSSSTTSATKNKTTPTTSNTSNTTTDNLFSNLLDDVIITYDLYISIGNKTRIFYHKGKVSCKRTATIQTLIDTINEDVVIDYFAKNYGAEQFVASKVYQGEYTIANSQLINTLFNNMLITSTHVEIVNIYTAEISNTTTTTNNNTSSTTSTSTANSTPIKKSITANITNTIPLTTVGNDKVDKPPTATDNNNDIYCCFLSLFFFMLNPYIAILGLFYYLYNRNTPTTTTTTTTTTNDTKTNSVTENKKK